MTIHPTADVQSNTIGRGTRVWQFCVILSGAQIGDDCNICAHVLIENDVVIGSRVTVKSGVQLWDGTLIGDDVHIGPNATFTNDRFPRSKQGQSGHHFVPARIRVGAGASIGANATIVPGAVIGEAALIGAGAVITRDVPAHRIMVGNPAKPIGWICTCGVKLGSDLKCSCGRQFQLNRTGVIYEVK